MLLQCLSVTLFQEQEENKSATSWPEYYIDQLNSMAAVSNNIQFIYSFLDIKMAIKRICPLLLFQKFLPQSFLMK